MKTLDQLSTSWDKKLSAVSPTGDACNSPRFRCVMDGQAVLDNETGLVWERYLGKNAYLWFNAVDFCLTSDTGGRRGWRLPTIYELSSLVEPNPALRAQSDVVLPNGHPFVNARSTGAFFTATTVSTSDSVTLPLLSPDLSVNSIRVPVPSPPGAYQLGVQSSSGDPGYVISESLLQLFDPPRFFMCVRGGGRGADAH
jgi:hypothetical protein